MRNEKLKRQAWPWPLHMIGRFQTVMGRGNRKGFSEGSGFWVWHTETTKCRKIKVVWLLEFNTEYQWYGGGYPYSCRGLSSEGTLRKRPPEQCTVQYLLLLQSFADQRNQKSQGIGSQECLACSSQGNQPYTMCTLYSCRKSEKQDSPKQVLSKCDLIVSEQSLRIVMKHETLSTQQLQRLAMH